MRGTHASCFWMVCCEQWAPQWFSITWLCWSWSRMRRRETAEEDADGEILCTVQQLRRRSGQANEPSRKSSVCRCSTFLSCPSLSSIREPATKWGSSHGKRLAEEEDGEDGGAPSFMEVYVSGETLRKECPETGCSAAFVDLCSCGVWSLFGGWGRCVFRERGAAFSAPGTYSIFLSLLLTYGPLLRPLLRRSVLKLLSLNVLSVSQLYPPPTLWNPSLTGETELELWCGCPRWKAGVADKWLWCW